MLEAVIFDMDGVIFDTESIWKEKFFEVLDQLRGSAVVVDNHTLEMIRMIQR